VLLDQRLYLATLVELPSILEAQKTLDFRTFFKANDVSQMLYIHNKFMDNFGEKTADEVFTFARGFQPVTKREDPEFFNSLYRRGEIGKIAEELKDKPETNISQEFYKFRNGLAPPTKNIRNIRYKKE